MRTITHKSVNNSPMTSSPDRTVPEFRVGFQHLLDPNDHTPSKTPTDREHLLRRWFARNGKPVESHGDKQGGGTSVGAAQPRVPWDHRKPGRTDRAVNQECSTSSTCRTLEAVERFSR
jgi:hypothetical protein